MNLAQITQNSFKVPDNLEERFHPPENLKVSYFENRRGQNIRYGVVLPDGGEPDCLVVILQGLSEFGEKYAEFMREQLDKNRACAFIDWAYQGGSHRSRVNNHRRHCDTFEDDADDLEDLIRKHIPELVGDDSLKDVPKVMVGHSMGAAIGTLSLPRLQNYFTCAAMCAPMYRINFPEISYPLIRGISSIAARYAPESYVPKGGDYTDADRPEAVEQDDLSKDPVRHLVHRQWFSANHELKVGAITWQWLNEALKTTSKITSKDFLNKIEIPMFIGTAGNDHLVKSSTAKKVSDILKNCHYEHYPNSYHEIIMERDDIRDGFMNQINELIECNI